MNELKAGVLPRRATAADFDSILESSNPANDKRYQRVGFEPVVAFDLLQGQRVTGMWRPRVARTEMRDP